MTDRQPTEQPSPQVSLWQVMKSVMAAFFGVQNQENRERDFQHGKPMHFIIMGIIATIMFILTVWGLVQLALYMSGVGT